MTTDQTARARIAAALSPMTVVGGCPPQLLVPVLDASNPRMARIADWQPLDALVDTLLATVSVPPPPPATRADARDRIAAAVDEGFRLYAELEDTSLGGSIVDSVLAAVLPEPADRAAVERVRSVLETEAVAGRSALEYRGLIASALMAAGAQQPTERCTRCTHPKRDHDGRADHRERHSPLVAGDPWCHACNAPCDYAEEPTP